MKQLLLCMLWCLSNSLSGQLTISPNPLALVGISTQNDIKYEIYLSTPKDTTYTLYWQLVKNNNFPAQWITYICDLEQCYFDNVDKCSNNAPNIIKKDSTYRFEFHLKPEGYADTSSLMFKLFTGKNMEGEILSVPMTLSTSISSIIDFNASQIKIFPNPTTDYFQVGNGQNVDKIVIYNLIGKEVKSLFHYNNAHHEINDLKSGMYVVKMFDDKGRVIKSIKLSKAFGGA